MHENNTNLYLCKTYKTGNWTPEKYKNDLEILTKTPSQYYASKKLQLPSRGVPWGFNYFVIHIVDKAKIADLRKDYEVVPFDINGDTIPGLENLEFSQQPVLVKKIARLYIGLLCLHMSCLVAEIDWVRSLIIAFDNKAKELSDAPEFQQLELKKHIDRLMGSPDSLGGPPSEFEAKFSLIRGIIYYVLYF